MAEFDPIPPKDADEAAYTQALLGDGDAGRELRHARLMAALPRPEVAAAVPVSDHSLAWRWQPYALGLLVTGLLLAAMLVLKGRPAEPRPEADPRLAASTPAVVVAQADTPVVEARPAAAAQAPRVAAKTSPVEPRAERSAGIVVADATPPRAPREAEVSAPLAEPPRSVMAMPPPAPVIAAAPPPAAVPASPPPAAAVAAAPAPPKTVAEASNQAEMVARAEVVASGSAARARAAPPLTQSLAASDTAVLAKPLLPANAHVLAAIHQVDVAATRSALQSGASVHGRDAQGRTLLMLAARTGSSELVELLLAAGARKADRDPQGWMAADHALAQGHAELAERLR